MIPVNHRTSFDVCLGFDPMESQHELDGSQDGDDVFPASRPGLTAVGRADGRLGVLSEPPQQTK